MTTNITHALISVSDKTGLLEFAEALSSLNIKILSTGGTAAFLREQQIPVTEVADITGFPEILSGRVKTLHPKIHGGILARGQQDEAALAELDIPPINLVVVNLYPFETTIAKPNCSLQEAIENIDIGGPTMLRGAAKNYEHTTVVTDPTDYPAVLEELASSGNTTLETRFRLARKVFNVITRYDAAISQYLNRFSENESAAVFPQQVCLNLNKKLDLRYGENPHQQAALYTYQQSDSSGISNAKQLTGKMLSFNNLLDADTAISCVQQFNTPACVIVKHANPCAVAMADNQKEAYLEAFKLDPVSSFGGIIAFNTKLEEEALQVVLDNQFVEVIIAPEVAEKCLNIVSSKPNVRLLTVSRQPDVEHGWDIRSISGGLLIQEADMASTQVDYKVVTHRAPTPTEYEDLLFAWQIIRFVKSNAIVYAKNKKTVGIGAGQMSRVFSAKIAALKAKEQNLDLHTAVMASDAFFPFRDGIDEAAALGISAIIQPGGSIKDSEIIAAANEQNIAMIFTGQRHFRH